MTEYRPPANFTPLAGLPAVVLDLETTGLDVRHDRVVQVGALHMLGPRIEDAPRFDCLVDPGIPVPPESTRIHGIGDADVSGAATWPDIMARLSDFIGNRVVLGHHVGFDLAVLRHEAARHDIAWREPASLDLATLCGALEPGLPDLGLESLADWLDVPVTDRHTAMGDCLTTARAFSALLDRLRRADVRTLGEARTFSTRRDDLAERRDLAGWNAVPGDAPTTTERPLARLDTYIYLKRLDDVMRSPPERITAVERLDTAAARMIERRIGSLLITDEQDRPIGIVTERDLLRAANAGGLGAFAVEDVMSRPVQCLRGDEMLYRALGRMTRKAVRHLCIVDSSGRAVGMVSQRDLLAHRAARANVLGDAIEEAIDGAGLAAIHGELPAVASALADEGLGGLEVARVVSNEIRALTARAANLALSRLESGGFGPAPAAWCVLVLGSGGRGESLLSADQDNALVHDGQETDDEWFAAFGKEMASMLDVAGIPLCRGGVMASNVAWRGTQHQWRARIGSWLQRARPEDLLNVDIFFDMVPVAGNMALARTLRKQGVELAAGQPAFMALLAESVSRLTPTLGLFGRLPLEGGRVDLKRQGLLPLVSMARVLALRDGSMARPTQDRLHEAAAAGRLAPGDARRLLAIHERLMTLVMRQQVADLHAGVKPTSRVEVSGLERDERRSLSAALGDLERILASLRATLSA